MGAVQGHVSCVVNESFIKEILSRKRKNQKQDALVFVEYHTPGNTDAPRLDWAGGGGALGLFGW